MKNNNGFGKTIQPIFSPAIALLNRISYTRKFTLLWMMSLVAIVVVVYNLFVSLERVIQPSQRELQGLVLIEPISRTVQFIQLHRGLSTALLGGNETMRERRATQEREAAEAFKAMEGKLPPRLASSEHFLRIKSDWEKLRKEGFLWTADENFAAHTRLIEQLQLFEGVVADDYALILDQEIATFYMIDTAVNKLPHAIEHLGQLRAYGTGILYKKQISETQRAKLYGLSAELDNTLIELRINIEKTGRYSLAVRESLLAAYGDIADPARQITGLVASDILTGHFSTPPDVFLDMATAEIDKTYTQMYLTLLPTTKALIEERIARAKKTLLTSVSGAALLFLLAVYFSVAMYYAIVGSIRLLVRSAHTFAEGDLSVRVKLNTRDELSYIGDSFNKMADGFNALLEARKQAEQALYESEKLYRSLFENMLNGFAYCQMLFEQGQPQDFIYLNVNAAFETQTGLKNVVGKKVSEVIPGIRQSDPELFEVYGRVALSGKPEQFEIYLKALQQWFWVSVFSPKEGYFVAVFDVITERKQADEALRKSKDLLQSVVENAPVRIFWKDRDSRYLGCNTNFAKAAGHSSPGELIGKTDFELWSKYLAELYRAGDKAVMDSGISRLDYEEPGTTPDGANMIWARTSKVPLRDESNRVIGILGIYEDITERKQVEQELIKSRQRAQLYLDTAGVMLIALDTQGRVQMINRKGCEMLGHSEADILGKDWFDNYLPESARKEVRKVFTRILDEVSDEYFDNEILTASGDVLTVAWHNSPLPDESGKIIGTFSSGADITERKQAEDSLRKLSLAVEQSPNSIVITGLDANIEFVNEAFVRTSGYSRADLIGQNPRILHSGKNPKAVYDDLWAHLTRGEVWKGELINRRKDGREYIEEEIISPVRQADGRVTHYLAIKEDITEHKQAERALMESKEMLHTVIETALDAVVQMNAAGIITGWNTQAEKFFGWPREEAVGRMMSETIIPPQYREAHRQGLKRFLATGEGPILNSRIEMVGLHRDGHEFPVELSIVPIKMGNNYEFSAFIRDITDRKEFENRIWKQANFDTLTGLPNRQMFYDRLGQEIRRTGRTGLTMALLYIDLDRFKEINDTLGHSMGDILLVEAARRISACVRETDTVARLGGDEFIITLTELNEISRVDALAQNILHELAKPFQLESEVVYLSASIGITLYPHDATVIEELIKNADQAMYAAKYAGRNQFSYFTQSMQQTAKTKLRLMNDLRGALAASQFMVYYQPIVELATGRIHKAEALIRWQHPVRGLVSPAEFIPLAEETGMILEIGDWVFREAAHQAKRWRSLYDPGFQISVNMSPIQFHSASSPCVAWSAYLRELGLPGQSLTVEITEGLLLKEEIGVKEKLLRFHEASIQISLDDFGTGYSSLSYLQKYDIDYLKIDQSFTRNLTSGSSNMALSEAIIMMAHRLDMKVIAEGVETEVQRELLANAGCNYAQGYLFSRPVPAEKFEELLKGALTGDSQT